MTKRIRLTLGALTTSPQESGSFAFFLYQDRSDRCIVISLTPPQMHAMFVNLKDDANSEFEVHSVFERVLREYRIELLEIEIVKREGANEFMSEILLFDGEREVKKQIAIVDGIILAKKFDAPLYISSKLMDECSVTVNTPYNIQLKGEEKKDRLAHLLELFNYAIDREDYERASVINCEIEALKKSLKNNKY